MPENVILGEFDRALLSEVQIDNQTPARILANHVGPSENAVLRRLRRDGLTVSDIAIVHPSVLGTPLTISIVVSLEREMSGRFNEFIPRPQSRPERDRQVYDRRREFFLQLRLAELEAHEAFTREIFHDDPNVRSFRTVIAI